MLYEYYMQSYRDNFSITLYQSTFQINNLINVIYEYIIPELYLVITKVIIYLTNCEISIDVDCSTSNILKFTC